MRSLLAISFSQTTWNPIWRFLLYQSWNLRSLLATSIDEYRNTRSLLAILTTWNPICRFLFTECYRCRSSYWQGLKTIICCSTINSMIISSSIILLECAKISSCNDPKKYMQWFMIRCNACIRTWFWNIGPILFFQFMRLPLNMNLLLKSYAGFISRVAYHILGEEVFDFLQVVLFSKCMTCICLFVDRKSVV